MRERDSPDTPSADRDVVSGVKPQTRPDLEVALGRATWKVENVDGGQAVAVRVIDASQQSMHIWKIR